MNVHQIPGEPQGVYQARPVIELDDLGAPRMTLRQWYAGLAMLGYHAGRPEGRSHHGIAPLTPEVVAMGCVRYADALLAELAKPIPQVEEVDLRELTMWDHDILSGRKVFREGGAS